MLQERGKENPSFGLAFRRKRRGERVCFGGAEGGRLEEQVGPIRLMGEKAMPPVEEKNSTLTMIQMG